MAFKRYATAHWEGDLKTGKGRMSTPQSGLFEETRYSFNTRFGDEKGTNPEELLAAAHAGCFSMALGFILQNAGVHLKVEAAVPGISADEFAKLADDAKANCVISKVLSIPVTLEARLA